MARARVPGRGKNGAGHRDARFGAWSAIPRRREPKFTARARYVRTGSSHSVIAMRVPHRRHAPTLLDEADVDIHPPRRNPREGGDLVLAAIQVITRSPPSRGFRLRSGYALPRLKYEIAVSFQFEPRRADPSMNSQDARFGAEPTLRRHPRESGDPVNAGFELKIGDPRRLQSPCPTERLRRTGSPPSRG
jgi:hypothetical protein